MPTPTPAERTISFAAPAPQAQQSTLHETLALIARPGLLSFALGTPATELLPLRACARAALQVQGAGAPPHETALERLRAHVVELMALRGVRCTPAEVFITTGAQHALSLLGQLLVAPGAAVLTEELTWDGLPGSLHPLKPRVLTVPSHPGTGMDLDALEATLAAGERPALLYTIPEGHNPLGNRIPGPARRRLAETARRHGVPVIEDDAYGLLSYDGDAPPALRAYDPEGVLYVGSFSKIVAPSLRAGWVVAPEPVVRRLALLEQRSDPDGATFAQHALCAWLDGAPLGGHLAALRRAYAARRDAMLAALEAHFPEDARWSPPRSGMFVWVEIPGGVDTTALLRRAVDEAGVAFFPGRAFCARGGVHGGSALRLSFSCLAPEQIHDGIARLGRVLRPRRVLFPPSFTLAAQPAPRPAATPAAEPPRRALYPVGEAPPLGHVPARMHAWMIRPERYGPPRDALRVEVTATPGVGPDEVLVYVMAAGINYNNVWAALGHPLDVVAYRRRLGAAEDFHIGGCDASGIVWKTGERVEHLRVGDEVVLHGGVWDARCPVARATGDPVLSPTFRAGGYEENWGSFAQFARAQAHQCLPRPAHLTWEESAAYMTSLTTAYRMLHRWAPHEVRAGDVVLVWGGAGGLGSMGVQLARVAGARPVAVVSADDRVEFCRRLGAVGCVDRRDFGHWGVMPGCDAAEHRRFLDGARAFLDAVRAAAGVPGRPRIVLEHPGRDTLATSVFVCAPGGMVVTCAGTSGYEGSFDLRYLWTRQKRLQGSHGMDDHDARCANELVSQGLVDPALGRAFRWDELDVPHQLMYENQHPAGNMAVLVGAPAFGTGAGPAPGVAAAAAPPSGSA